MRGTCRSPARNSSQSRFAKKDQRHGAHRQRGQPVQPRERDQPGEEHGRGSEFPAACYQREQQVSPRPEVTCPEFLVGSQHEERQPEREEHAEVHELLVELRRLPRAHQPGLRYLEAARVWREHYHQHQPRECQVPHARPPAILPPVTP